MDPIHNLSIRTAAAATRLAQLEVKRDSVGIGSQVTGVAFRELQGAIEELKVAIEQLHEMSDGLAAARVEAEAVGTRYDELMDALPLACLFTDDDGRVAEANRAAADLFNISARHLCGKPLLLFVADRDHFFQLMAEAKAAIEPLQLQITIRPRDRKARRVEVQVRHLRGHALRCWFFREIDQTERLEIPDRPPGAMNEED